MSSASDKSDATATSRLISSAAAPGVDFFFFFGDLLCGRQAADTSCFLSRLKSEATGCGILKHCGLKQGFTTATGWPPPRPWKLGRLCSPVTRAFIHHCRGLTGGTLWNRKEADLCYVQCYSVGNHIKEICTKLLEMADGGPENWAAVHPKLRY